MFHQPAPRGRQRLSGWRSIALRLAHAHCRVAAADRYKAIGGGSPLRRITEEQADALSQALARKGQEASVYVAMRYWKPFTEDALEQACTKHSCLNCMEFN